MLDEAVSALDVSVPAQALNLIRDLQAEDGFAALFIAHGFAATRHLSHRIAVMKDGAGSSRSGPATASCAEPEHAYSRALLAAAL